MDTGTDQASSPPPEPALPEPALPEPALPEPALPEPVAAGAAPPRGWRSAVALDTAVPLAIYLASRAVQVALVAWLGDGWRNLIDRLMSWDAAWFVRIAAHGYPHGYSFNGSGQMVGNGLAFFPAYPGAIAAVHLFGVPLAAAALVVSAATGAVAAVVVHRLGAALYDRRTGYVLVALVFGQPMSVVFSMGYSEGLFVVAAAGALLAAYRRSWLVAGLLGVLAGLTRPTGLAVGVALAVAALMAHRRGEAGARAWSAVAASLVAVPAYLAWVGLRVGDPYAWLRIQTAGWGTRFDYGVSTTRFVLSALHGGDGWVEVSCAMIIIAAVVAAAWAVLRRTWPPLLVYGLIIVALTVYQAGYYHSKPRLLVPALIVLVPAAVAAGRARRTSAVVLGVLSFALFGLWYGAYMITVWQYAI